MMMMIIIIIIIIAMLHEVSGSCVKKPSLCA